MSDLEIGGIEFADPSPDDHENRTKRNAKRFVDLVNGDMSKGDAVKELGMTPTQFYSQRDMFDHIKWLMEVGHVKPEVKREVIRAGLFKEFVEGITSTDLARKKLALEASKQMAADPDIGLSEKTEAVVNINLGTLGEAIKGIEFEGLKNPFQPTSNEIDSEIEGEESGS